MNDRLQVLAEAIHDVGYWRWWTAELPEVIQLEFGGVQLATVHPGEASRPLGPLALRFRRPAAAGFLTREDAEVPTDWAALLQRDAVDPFTISNDLFTLHDPDVAKAVVEMPSAIITAADLQVVTHQGAVDLADVPRMHDDWWDYWREYWRRRGTSHPLPEDYACEVTIPAL